MSLLDRSPRREKGEDEFAFQRKVSRGQTPTPPKFNRCQLMVGDRLMAGITMALPFVVCFTTFGIFNLIAGSILTSMAWKPTNVTWDTLTELPKPRDKFERLKREKFLDPLKVMGPILLITGVMLVLVGFALGVTACRSVYSSRDPSKSSMVTHYTAAIQLSGFNGPNNYGMPWMGKSPPPADAVVAETTDTTEKKSQTALTEATIETASLSSDLKDFKETAETDKDKEEESKSSGYSAATRNNEDVNVLDKLDSAPGCSYFESQLGLRSHFQYQVPRPQRADRNGVGLWEAGELSETCFLVPPFDLNPETYIT